MVVVNDGKRQVRLGGLSSIRLIECMIFCQPGTTGKTAVVLEVWVTCGLSASHRTPILVCDTLGNRDERKIPRTNFAHDRFR